MSIVQRRTREYMPVEACIGYCRHRLICCSVAFRLPIPWLLPKQSGIQHDESSSTLAEDVLVLLWIV